MTTLAAIVHRAIGEAATCWSDLDHAGVYDSTKACEIAKRLNDDIREYYKGDNSPKCSTKNCAANHNDNICHMPTEAACCKERTM